jgi:hypothetical protein
MDKKALITSFMAIALAGEKKHDSFEIQNPYSSLPAVKYNGIVADKRSPLNKKQSKSRAAAKRAKKARRKNRN